MGKDWSQCQGEGGKDEDVPALELSPGAWDGIMSERVLLRMCRESVSCLLNDSYYSAHLGAATCAILHPVVFGTPKKKIMDLGNIRAYQGLKPGASLGERLQSFGPDLFGK